MIMISINSLTATVALIFVATYVKHISAFHHGSRFSGTSLVLHRRTFGCVGSELAMGMQIKIRIVGRKNSEQWLQDAYSMYETRLRSSNLDVETVWHKTDSDLIKGVEGDRAKGHSIVLLDPRGTMKTSEQFCEDMYKSLDSGGSRMNFVIGGAEGLPAELKYPKSNRKPNMMSLSTLTFTHQFARTLLMEQIYRASEIRKGSGYHK